MDRRRLEEYHATRDYSDKAIRSACYAPHVSMYFDTRGNVVACCQNSKFPLGNIAQQRLPEIWHGERTKKLRKALQKDSFGAGCQFCEWQISVGNYLNAFTRNFDRFKVETENPDWPRMMEFSISNTCNLECLMCYGELSSSIRARREGLPPLPKAYGDQFFEDLRPFLHHLEFAKFLGGEPFLETESFRIWDLMHEEGVSFHCNVTTNGTQWNERVEQVLERFPISICLSIDATTKETYEGIRINSNFETVHQNFRRFHEYCNRRKTPIVLTYCLMRQNWHEFGDYLLFAEEWNTPVGVNLVYEPPQCSLWTLPVSELEKVASSLERQTDSILPKLKINARVWTEQVTAIRNRVQHATESARSPFQTPLALVVLGKEDISQKPGRMNVDSAKSRIREALGADIKFTTFVSDQDDKFVRFEEGDNLFGLPLDDCLGNPFSELVSRLSQKLGPQRTVTVNNSFEYIDRCLLFHHPDGKLWGVRQVSIPRFNEFGMAAGSTTVTSGKWITPDSLSMTEKRITGILDREWDASALRTIIELDEIGNIRALPADDSQWLGLRPKLEIGMSHAEFLLACKELWGSVDQTQSIASIDFEEIAFRYDNKSEIVVMKLITIPTFEGNGHTGYRRHMALTRIDATRAKESESRIPARLEAWSGNKTIFRLVHNKADQAIQVESPTGGFFGLDESNCLGRTSPALMELMRSKFGAERMPRYVLRPDDLDVVVDFDSPAGHHAFRVVVSPHFNSAGHCIGTVRHMTGIQFDREASLEREAEGYRTLREWSGGAPILRMLESRDGQIADLGYPEATYFGLPLDDLKGMTQGDLQKRLVEQFGEMRQSYYMENAQRLDVIVDYARGDSMLLVRAFRFPAVDLVGRGVGTGCLIAGVTINSQESADLETKAIDRLQTWDAHARRVRVFEGRDGKIQSIEGTTSLFGVDLQEFMGQSIERVVERFESQFGAKKFLSWSQTAKGTETLLEFEGSQSRALVRLIMLPSVGSGKTGSVYWLAGQDSAVSTPHQPIDAAPSTDEASAPNPAEFNGAALMQKIEKAADELKAWAQSDQFMCLVEDEFGRILEVDSARPDFLGIPTDSLPSSAIQGLRADLETKFGPIFLRDDSKRIDREDAWVYHLPKSGVLSLRAIAFPKPVPDRSVSNIRLIVAREYAESDLKRAYQEAEHELASWSGGDVLAMAVLSDGRCEWRSEATTWNGLTPTDINGKSMDHVAQMLTRKWGTIEHRLAARQPIWDDAFADFKSANSKRQVRSLSLPLMSDEGDHIGRIQFLAAKVDVTVPISPDLASASC